MYLLDLTDVHSKSVALRPSLPRIESIPGLMVGTCSIANAASLELPVLQHGIPNRTGMTGHSFLTIHPFYCYMLPSFPSR